MQHTPLQPFSGPAISAHTRAQNHNHFRALRSVSLAVTIEKPAENTQRNECAAGQKSAGDRSFSR